VGARKERLLPQLTEAGKKGIEGRGPLQARVHILVSGRVQGVLFRKTMMDLAKTINVTGWVRNLRDGSVEATAEGERTRLEELIEFCHLGPPGARVTSVAVNWSHLQGEFRGFRIVH
jgi:acylphosphatase